MCHDEDEKCSIDWRRGGRTTKEMFDSNETTSINLTRATRSPNKRLFGGDGSRLIIYPLFLKLRLARYQSSIARWSGDMGGVSGGQVSCLDETLRKER